MRTILSRIFIGLPFLAVIAAQAYSQQKPSPRRPNIVFMMSDDHAYQAISAYGYGLNKTPGIDALAADGMLFKRAFVTNSLCGPSRAVFLTGKHSHKNGFRQNGDRFDGSQQTFVKLLRQAGYQTAVVGKWHLSSDPEGFDYWNIVPGQGDYYNPRFRENGVPVAMNGYVTNVTMGLALQWLENRNREKPFFLICNQKAPHRNWMPEPKYYHLFDSTVFPLPANFFDDYATRGRAAREQEMEVANDMHPAYDLKLAFEIPMEEREGLAGGWHQIYNRLRPDEKLMWQNAYSPSIEAFRKNPPTGKDLDVWQYQRYMRDYLRCVQSVDDNVGRLMDYLRMKGLDSNTIVVYTSDQGFFLGEHGWYDKRFMYEESFRTPLIVRWPGVTKGRGETRSMVQNLDMAQTLLEMAGLPSPRDMQGKSMVPVLNGALKGDLHEALYYHFYENGEHNVAKHLGIRTDRHKLVFFYELGEWELYDLVTDPSEMRNLYGQPQYRKLADELGSRLLKLTEGYDDREAVALLKAARKKTPASE